MSKTFIIGLSMLLLGGLMLAQSEITAEQSLGDIARTQRSNKKTNAKRIFTNEDLAARRPSSDAVSETKPAAPSDKKSAETGTMSADTKKEAANKDAAPSENSTAVEEKYRNSVRKQRETIAALEKEIADNEHKVQVQSTNYYMDAGARYRDPKAWTEQREKMNKEIDTKREKLAEARGALDRLHEEARKLGIPSGRLE